MCPRDVLWLEITNVVVVVYPLPWPLLEGGVRCSRLWSTSQLLRPSGQQCSRSGGVCPQIPGVTMWCVCGCGWRDDMCRVCGCYRGGIVVMDVFWRRLCVSIIWGREICLFWVGQGCDEWGGEVSLQSCKCVVEVCAVFCWLAQDLVSTSFPSLFVYNYVSPSCTVTWNHQSPLLSVYLWVPLQIQLSDLVFLMNCCYPYHEESSLHVLFLLILSRVSFGHRLIAGITKKIC